jgi:hypothetical protein
MVREHVARHGHARVPQHHRLRSFALGQWVNRQRQRFRQGLITPEQARALAGLPGWTWDPLGDDFGKGLEHLRRYVRRCGDARVPQDHVERGFGLGRWVSHRRREYRNGRLPQARTHELEAVPGWTWDLKAEQLQERFDEGLTRLRRYVRSHGHARVPPAYVEDGFRLGLWVVVRRRQYRAGRLSARQVRVLEALPGWTWAPGSL